MIILKLKNSINMKTLNLKSLTLVLFLLSASLQVWGWSVARVTGSGFNNLNSWDNTDSRGDMTNTSGTIWSKTFTSESDSQHQFKITFDGSWDGAIGWNTVTYTGCSASGSNNGNISFTPNNAGEVTITYDSSNENITITCTSPCTVTYNGNGNTSGSVPTDGTSYSSGSTVTVKGNTGNLVKTDCIFSGWNTAADGSGTFYAPGNTFSISGSTTLYAIWLDVGILNGTKIMVYGGELTSWNQSNYYFMSSNNTNNTVATASLTINKTINSENYKFGATTLATGTYYQGHWASGLSCSITAGSAYVVRGSGASSTYFTQKANSDSNYLYQVKKATSTSPTTTATTTISSSINEGESISISTSSLTGVSVLGNTNTLQYYLYDGSSWSKLTVSNGTADVSSLSAGTGYKIVTVLYDGNIYVNADEDTFSVVAPANNYTISYTTASTGWSYGTKPTSAAEGATVNFVVTPTTGYTVTVSAKDASNNTVSLTNSGTSYSFTMPSSNVTITVSAVEQTYAVTINSASGGTVSPSGSQSVGLSGITVTATPYPGYKFSSWATTGGAAVANSSNASTTLTATAAGTLTPSFARTYAFIEGRFRVYNSTRTTVTTTYASGGQWDESSTRIQMNYDATNHRFYLNTYMTAKELSTNHGSGCNDCKPYFYIKTSTSNSSLANVTSYLSSSSTTLSAAGSANKKTLGQSGNNANLRFDSSDESGYVILYFDEAGVWYEIEAAAEYTLTVNVSPSGAGSITVPSGGTASVTRYSTTTITATKNNGYTFVNWTKTGTATITNANSLSTTVTGVQSDATVTANFTQDNYTVTVNSVGGEISAPSGGTFTNKHYGDVVTITAVNPDALTFVGWTASPADNATIADATLLSTTATIKGDVTLTARFHEPIKIYFSNEQCWDAVHIHAWGAVGGTVESDFPGNAMTQDEDGWWTYTFDKAITQVNILFANSSGSNQSNDCSSVTATTYYKMSSTTAGQRGIETTTSSYEPSRCTPDVYTVVGDEALVGSSWDTGDGANEMIWNSTNNRYELRKVNVSLAVGYKYYRFVKNHCYLGSGCGQWPAEGQSNANYNFTTAKSYDLVFWLKPGDDFSHPGLDNTYGLEVSDAATYYINHPWGDGNGSWTKVLMTYSGSGNTYYASGVFGDNGADIFNGDTKVKYFANNSSDISGYNSVTAGDNVVFTYDASAKTLSVSCPTCSNITKYWICVPRQCGNEVEEQPKLMTYNPENGLYYTDPTTLPYKWPSNGVHLNANNNCNDNWINETDIINHEKMTCTGGQGTPVQYIYDPEINQLTVVDANTPTFTLTATQAVNAAATQSDITLRTTSSKQITNATYTYTKLSGPDGTLAESTTNTTTFTTTNEGTYNFKVTVSCDEGTFTANCTVKVKFKIIVYANVAAPGWTGTINMYYWATGVTAANHAMTSVGGKWYKYEVKGVPEFSFIVRNNTGSGNAQTVDIGPIDDDICIIVSSDIQYDGTSRLYSTTTDCELYMRFASTYTQMKGEQNTGVTKTVYSNLFKQNGDQVSFYVGTRPQVKFQTFNSTNNAWNAGITVATGVSGGNVYYGEYNSSASNKLKDFTLYNDDFYLRSDAAPNGWSNYKSSNQAFFQFSHNDYYPNEWYNHYYCRWTGSGTNVKAVVGNTINPAVSDTLDDFYLTQNTNMRFEYDNETNYIGRQFLKGSTNGFLQIFASDTDAENFIYDHNSSNTRIKKTNAVTFTDMSDWVYLVDVYAKPAGEDVNVYVLGRYPVTRTGIGTASDQDNYLGGYDTKGVTPLPIKIMGSSTTPDTYNMRLIYDYKTNRLMAAWYPKDNNVGGTDITTVDANFMLSRYNDEVAQTVGFEEEGAKVVSINQMIAALTISRNAYKARKSDGNFYYWVSLPYDVYVRDIYGISGYGKKWVVQRYRGDMRAKYGFLDTIETFWANMKQNATAKMEANRGYVIRLQLTDDDFKEINNISQVTLYFPSCNTEDIQLKNSTTALQTSVPEHLCEVVEPNGTPRMNWDSHWNVIGQPGMKTMEMTNPTELPSGTPAAGDPPNHPKFFYKWSWTGGQGVYTPTAVSGTDNAFQTMYAYMVQYGGETITWQKNVETIDPSLAPRKTRQATNEDLLISLTASAEREIEHIVGEDKHSEYEQVTDFDRTLLTLSERGSDNFVLNRDMAKTKSGKLNIYTVFDKTNTAGKVIPMQTTEVPVVVEINYENEVIFALDKEISKKTIIFVDYSEGTETILNSSEYKVNLPAGKYDKRFAIRISERTEIPTDITENANADTELHLLRDGQQLYFEGLTQNETLRIFDATGKCLMSTTISNGEHFGVPSQGMYLLQVGTQTFKVAIN